MNKKKFISIQQIINIAQEAKKLGLINNMFPALSDAETAISLMKCRNFNVRHRMYKKIKYKLNMIRNMKKTYGIPDFIFMATPFAPTYFPKQLLRKINKRYDYEELNLFIVGKTKSAFQMQCGFSLNDLYKQKLIVGGYGEGKTETLISDIASMYYNVPEGLIIVFDIKNDFKILKSLFKDKIKIVKIPSDGSFRINFFYPPKNVPLMDCINNFLDEMQFYLEMYDTSAQVIKEIVNYLYKNNYSISLKMLHDFLYSNKNIENLIGIKVKPHIYSTIYDRIRGLMTNFGEMVDCERGAQISDDFKYRIIVYNLTSPNRSSRNVFISNKITRLFKYKQYNPQDKRPIMIVLDEANNILNKSIMMRTGMEPPLIYYTRMCRQMKIIMLMAAQEPSLLCPTARNTGITVAYKLGNIGDQQVISTNLNLKDPSSFNLLNKYEAFVKESRYPLPYIVKMHDYKTLFGDKI